MFQNWQLRAKSHEQKISPFTDSFTHRRSCQKTHPVHDFLFIYYDFSPSKLKQWMPSLEEVLLVDEKSLNQFSWLNQNWFQRDGNLLSYQKELISSKVKKLADWIASLCEQILTRAPRFSCLGLHEWAMVYKLTPEEIRHRGYPLRLSLNELATFVESQKICCSHYDAFRFFTDPAKPLNTLQPTFKTRLEFEQAGCVHANMDLYKWATKLWPWIGSDFLAKAFFLALTAREIDMRASPYDLTSLGYLPICIETEEGRKEYIQKQQSLSQDSQILREELLRFAKKLSQLKVAAIR